MGWYMMLAVIISGFTILLIVLLMMLGGAITDGLLNLAEKSSDSPGDRARKRRQDALLTLKEARTELEGMAGPLHSDAVIFSGVERQRLEELWALLPMVPIGECLRLQEVLFHDQAAYLRDCPPKSTERYDMSQFSTDIPQHIGIWENWQRLAVMGPEEAGPLWHTLVELVCRLRDPELCQSVIRALSREAAAFWLLGELPQGTLERRWDELVEQFTAFTEREQQTPYLYAVMFLQVRLGTHWAVPPETVLPQFAETAELDGVPVFLFDVGDRDWEYHGRYAVEQRTDAARKDLRVWRLTTRWQEITAKLAAEST